jgi:SAM-dependent methyltransferase
VDGCADSGRIPIVYRSGKAQVSHEVLFREQLLPAVSLGKHGAAHARTQSARPVAGRRWRFRGGIVQKHLDASVFVVDFAETLAIESDLYGNFAGMFAGDISAPDWVSPLESVDAVFWFDNIEHLRIDPTRILRKLRSALSENGQIFITTDNFARLRNILKLIFNRSIVALPKDLFAEVDFEHEYVHRREYTRPELEACLREAGLKLAEVEMLWQSPSESLKKLPFRSFEYLFPRFRPHMLIRAQKAEQDVRLTTG